MRSRGAPSLASALAVAFAIGVAACASTPALEIPAAPAARVEPVAIRPLDTAPKEELRLVPPEVTLRTWLHLFGALAPLDAEKRARGRDGSNVFDTWDDYVAALGFPDHRLDVPRQTQTNALMMATFERVGVALCDRALEHDWKRGDPRDVTARVIFDFDAPRGVVSPVAFAVGFDVLHRTFLGYPAALAPPERSARFFALYDAIVKGHAAADPRSRFTPAEAGWASVCYGLVRHPEFHLY